MNLNKLFSQRVIKITVSCLVFILAVFLFVPIAVHAQSDMTANLDTVAGQTVLQKTDPRIIVGNIIKVALGLIGAIGLIIVLGAGFLYMTAGGDETKLGVAKKWLKNGFIGLVIIFAAYSITSFVFGLFDNSNPNVNPPGYFLTAGLAGGGYNISGGAFGHIIQSHYPEPEQTGVPRNTQILVTFKTPIFPGSVIDENSNANCPPGVATCGEIKKDAIRVYKCADMMAEHSLDVTKSCQQVPFYDIAEGRACAVDSECGGGNCVNNICNGNKLVPGYAMMTEDNKTLIFNPFNNFNIHLGSEEKDETYIVYLTSAIQKLGIDEQAGGGVFNFSYPDYKWRFTTGTFVDLTPPTVTSVVPANVEYPISAESLRNCKCGIKQIGCSNADCQGKVYLNQAIYINFSEPVIPPLTQIQGCGSADGVGDNEVQMLSDSSIAGCDTNFIPGTWRVGLNQYRTIQFVADTDCEQGASNSCGEPAKCLPSNANITGRILAAEIISEGVANPGTGIMDMGGNSLDGNANGQMEGPGPVDTLASDLATILDSYYWDFLTGNTLDLIGPVLTNLNPSHSVGATAGSISPTVTIKATFSEDLDAQSVDEEVYLYGKHGNGKDFDGWFDSNFELVDADSDPSTPAVVNMTTIAITHAPFREYEDGEDLLPIYTPIIKSELKDTRMNCFSPTVNQDGSVEGSSCNNNSSGYSCCPQDGTFGLQAVAGDECAQPLGPSELQ